jgi:hypothetical protein
MSLFSKVNQAKSALFGPFRMKSGIFFGSAREGLEAGYSLGFKGNAMFLLPAMAVAAATAPRGDKLGEVVGTGVAALGTVLGGLLGGPMGAFAGTLLLDPLIASGVGKGINRFARMGPNTHRLEMGGDFKDNEVFYTMRQRGAAEMGQSLLNARQYLGKEARLMHQ